MGAWSYGLFENDVDADLVCEFDDEAGLKELEKIAEKKFVEENGNKTEEKNRPPYYTINGGGDAKEEIRKHLDSGVLEKMFAKREQEILESKKDFYPVDYAFCFLGACAMTVGCHIPPQHKLKIRARFLHVGFLEPAEWQLANALNCYQEGVPFSFGDIPKDMLEHHMSNTRKQLGGSLLMNVPAPFGLYPRAPPKDKTLRNEMDERKYGAAACGGCGAEKKKDGESLLRCAKCKKRGYCSTDCQKEHWKLHKKVCVAAVPEPGKENVTSQTMYAAGRRA